MPHTPTPNHWDSLTAYSSFARRSLNLWSEACQQLLIDNRLNSKGVLTLNIQTHWGLERFNQKIREHRHTECLRIAWRDVNHLAQLEQTLADLSFLAEQLLQASFEFHFHLLSQRFGEPQTETQNHSRFCIIGMGKLGGNELNFSSDLDLLFVYSGSGKTTGPRRIDCIDFYTRLVQAMIQSLETTSVYGQAYRIDTRLRPYGNSGRLVWNTTAMEQYYVSEGRDWERYALLKARPVAADKALGFELLGDLQPFIYRRYLDYGLFQGVRELRHEIAHAAAKQGQQNNLKLGPGGIREIEFLIQSLQLLRGGQQPVLRQQNLLKALALLQQHQWLETDVAHALGAAYRLLRRLENCIQILDDQQDHSIPKDPQQFSAWVALSGYSNSETLLQTLNHARQQVSAHFDVWFGESDKMPSKPIFRLETHADISNWLTLLTAPFEHQDHVLPTQFEASLKRLLKQPISQNGRQRLQQLLPKLLLCAENTPMPKKHCCMVCVC